MRVTCSIVTRPTAQIDDVGRALDAMDKAIRERLGERARGAMRRHLTNSLKRYRKLAEESKQG